MKKLYLIGLCVLMSTLFTVFIFQSEASESNLSDQELLDVIKGAVEDDRWLFVKSPEMARCVLAQYYTGQLLEENTQQVWETVKYPTDWYWKAAAQNIKVISNNGKEAVATAEILDYDLITGEIKHGQAKYFLLNTEKGWRVAEAKYQW